MSELLNAKSVVEKGKSALSNEKHILAVMEKTGWSREYAEAEISEACARLNISYRDYNVWKIYNFPLEEQGQRCKSMIRKRQLKEEKDERFVQLVAANTGWTTEKAIAHMKEAQRRTGATYEDYAMFRFWELDHELQSTYLTRGHGLALRKKYNTNTKNVACFKNKQKFNEIFHEYIKRPWMCNTEMTLERFRETFRSENRVIYKPMEASCGAGVAVYELHEDNYEEVYEALVKLPYGMVEGYIVQHPEIGKFAPNSVNTVRITTLYANNKVNIIFGFLRMGGGTAVVDNFHRGGVLAMIDLEEGVITTPAIDLNGHLYASHPHSKEPVIGFRIPFWTEICEMVSEAGKLVRGIGFVGWDVAVTEDGPLLIEGNTAIQPLALQLSYAKQGKGVYHIIKDFM